MNTVPTVGGDYKKYPMWMHHPGEQPAIISDDYDQGVPRIGYNANPGRARAFPPVLVQNADQEEFHTAKGYLPGNSDKAAAIRMALPAGYQYAEYPQMVDGRLVGDPNAPPLPTNEFPKWVETPTGEVLVQSAEQEELVLRGSSKNEPTRRDEPAAVYPGNCGDNPDAECGLRDPAKCATHGPLLPAKPVPEPIDESPTEPDIDDLRELAAGLGIIVDRRWGERRLREEIAEIERATAPAAA